MGITPNADAAASNSDVADISRLISALAPIFLGQSGQQTQQTSGQQAGTTTGATGGTTTSTSTTTKSAPSDIINSLLATFNQANTLATDKNASQTLIDAIMHKALIDFAPTIANANAAGLYNSSTLGLLAGNAAAEAGRQGAVTALNFQQGEQQIAGNIGKLLLDSLGSTTTTGTQTQNQATTQQTTQQTAGQTQTNTKQNPQAGSLGSASSIIPILGIISSLFGPSIVKGLTGSTPNDLVGSGFDYVKRLLFGDDGGLSNIATNIDNTLQLPIPSGGGELLASLTNPAAGTAGTAGGL